MAYYYPAYVLSINISKGGIPKFPVDRVRITKSGLEGDGHHHEKHNRPTQAVCLQDIEKLTELDVEGYPVKAGTLGENLTVRNLRVNKLSVGTRLRFAGGVELELTKVRKPCYVLDAVHPQLQKDIEGRCGMYAQVLKEGEVHIGESIEIV